MKIMQVRFDPTHYSSSAWLHSNGAATTGASTTPARGQLRHDSLPARARPRPAARKRVGSSWHRRGRPAAAVLKARAAERGVDGGAAEG